MSGLGWKYLSRDDVASILRGIEEGKAFGGPYHAEIHPSDRCNIDCFFCSTAAIRGNDDIPAPRLHELIDELVECGTRAVRLSGGGEPLFHRGIAPFLDHLASRRLRMENLTTNAVLLRPGIAEKIVPIADQITVSLNTADSRTYASMMQTPERNFERVIENVRAVVRLRDQARLRQPEVQIQFLVWKDNYRTIPQMYRLAVDAGADRILFSGLAFLRPDQKMSEAERDEMMRLYEELVAKDEYRRIISITSFEHRLEPLVAAMNARLAEARGKRTFAKKIVDFAARPDFTLAEKLRHFGESRQARRRDAATRGLETFCLIAWHSLVVRTSGEVGPCCIMQQKSLGNVFRSAVRDVWYGPEYQRFRGELRAMMAEGDAWSGDAARDRYVEPMCAKEGECPIRSFYFGSDVAFMKAFQGKVSALRQPVV